MFYSRWFVQVLSSLGRRIRVRVRLRDLLGRPQPEQIERSRLTQPQLDLVDLFESIIRSGTATWNSEGQIGMPRDLLVATLYHTVVDGMGFAVRHITTHRWLSARYELIIAPEDRKPDQPLDVDVTPSSIAERFAGLIRQGLVVDGGTHLT